MLRQEYVGVLEYLSETGRSDAGGNIPRGTCYVDSPDLFIRYTNGDHIGDALGIRLVLDVHIADGWVKFYNDSGALVSTGIAFTV